MDDLERKLTGLSITKNNWIKKATNMTREQHYLLQMFFNHDLFIIVASNKNLGIIIMERNDYIVRALKYHLLDTKTYRLLGPGELEKYDTSVRKQVMAAVKKARHFNNITKEDRIMFKRAEWQCTRIPSSRSI